MRLVGGLAIRVHAHRDHPSLDRAFKDIDVVTVRKGERDVGRFLRELGYEPDSAFNTLNSGRRALFYDVVHQRQLDVFVGGFQMCHAIPIADRLDVDPQTVPLAELLLTKLQIVHLNDKDLRDIVALLLDHDVADTDDEAVNGAVVARLCSDDWGLWRTCHLTIDAVRGHLDGLGLPTGDEAVLLARLDALEARLDSAPKTRRWRLRDRVGDRVRWYEEPEEVAH